MEILTVETPSRGLLEAHCAYKDCNIKDIRIKVFVNLILLDFLEFDVILEIDWLEKYRVIIDYESKIIILQSSKKNLLLLLNKQEYRC